MSFIISTGRTGTKFLAHLATDGLSGVEARHEPRPDLFDFGIGYLRSHPPIEQVCAEFLRVRYPIYQELLRAGRGCYVESNNNAAYLIPVIRRVFKNLRIVHVVRDGRNSVRSTFSKPSPSVSSSEETVLVMTDNDPRERLKATDFRDDPYTSAWSTMSRFERICWYWAKKDGIIADATDDCDNTMRVRFEDLFDPQTVPAKLAEVVRFTAFDRPLRDSGISMSDALAQKRNQTKSFLMPHWTEWIQEQTDRFWEIAGAHMERLGYKR